MLKSRLTSIFLYFLYFMSVTIGQYDKDGEMSRCEARVCAGDCRRLRYHTGTCIEDSLCYCDEDEYGLHTVPLKTKCESYQCRQDCLRLKYPSGKCIDAGLCYCDKNIEDKDVTDSEDLNSKSQESYDVKETQLNESNLEETNSHINKNNKHTDEQNKSSTGIHKEICERPVCKAACVKEGYHSGFCVIDTCYCNVTKTHNNTDSNTSSQTSEDQCVESDCNKDCRSLDYRSGSCGHDHICYCEYSVSKENVKKTPPPASKKSPTKKKVHRLHNMRTTFQPASGRRAATYKPCDNSGCHNFCVTKDVQFGVCYDGKCMCVGKPTPCKEERCNWMCQGKAYVGGSCATGHCRCYEPYMRDNIPTMLIYS